jgi:hypothetical protein
LATNETISPMAGLTSASTAEGGSSTAVPLSMRLPFTNVPLAEVSVTLTPWWSSDISIVQCFDEIRRSAIWTWTSAPRPTTTAAAVVTRKAARGGGWNAVPEEGGSVGITGISMAAACLPVAPAGVVVTLVKAEVRNESVSTNGCTFAHVCVCVCVCVEREKRERTRER